MDGNGRWAKERGRERLYGHIEGTESVRACSELAAELGLRYLSLFAFSEENWNRPEDEVMGLMSLMAKSILNEKVTFAKNNIRFMVLGNRAKIPSDLLQDIDNAMEETKSNSGLTLIVFLSYSGKWDILQAAERYAKDGMQNPFESYLCTSGIPDPDLLIRTSGEKRISNFLLWQCAYTEFYFTELLWPDFRKTQFRAAIDDFCSRERRFGKTSDQIK
jgi:undecaprenyl diphosphate synthase